MDLLQNAVMPYAWGSRSALRRILGRAPPGDGAVPEAELWMGAHPKAPSGLQRGGARAGLDIWIANDPVGELGASCLARHGPRLPFLVKLLCAELPLSIQVHPSQEQAEQGFARDEAEHLPLGAASRRYVDRGAKPELLCALEPVDALVGLRAPEDAVRVLRELGLDGEPGLASVGAGDYAAVLRALFGLSPAERARVVERAVAGSSCGSEEAALVLRLASLYPGDVGVVVALLLRRIRLAPLEAIFLPPGVLHAYLSGAGVEIMASSDNVLRGGLTPKPVHADELLRIVDVRHAAPQVLGAPIDGGASTEHRWAAPTPAFALSLLLLRGEPLALERRGPEVLFCLDGPVSVEPASGAACTLERGEVAYSPHRDGALRVRGAGGRLFRATTGSA